MGNSIKFLIGGMFFMVLALALAPTIITFAATSGSDPQIGSFSGTSNMNNLFPMFYYILTITGSVTAMGVGGGGLVGKGPLARGG